MLQQTTFNLVPNASETKPWSLLTWFLVVLDEEKRLFLQESVFLILKASGTQHLTQPGLITEA